MSKGKVLVIEDSDSIRGYIQKVLKFSGLETEGAENGMIGLKKTEELAIVDELTGMYNYRFFRDKLNTEIQRAIR